MTPKMQKTSEARSRVEVGLKTSLIFGASGVFGLRLANLALTLLISVLLARSLGPVSYGIYAFSFSLAELLVMPSLFGLQQLLVREVPSMQSKQSWSLLKGLLRRANQAVLYISLALSGLVILAGSLLAENHHSPEHLTLVLAMLLMVFMALTRMHMAILRGLRHIILSQLPQMMLRPSILALMLGLAIFFLQVRLSPAQAMLLHLLAAAASLGFILFAVNRAKPRELSEVSPEYDTKQWFWSALPLMLAGCLNILNQQISIILLGILGTADQAGLYQVAKRGAALVPFSLTAVNMAIAPAIAKLYTEGDLAKIQTILTSSARAVLAFSLPTAMFLILMGPWLVPLVFGQEYSEAALPLAILCTGQLVNAGLGSVGLALNMTGHERDTARGISIAAGANVLLNLLLIPLLGVLGAAVATSSSLLIWNVLLAYWVQKRLGLYTTALGKFPGA